MKIKDILIKLKNQSIVESYEKKFDIVADITELYTEKLIEKYSYTKDKLIQENKNQLLMKKVKKNKSITNPRNIAKNVLISFLISILTTLAVSPFTTLGFTLQNLWHLFPAILMPTSVFYVIFYFIKHSILKEQSDSIEDTIFKQSSQYIKNNYNSFYNKITFELIEELDSVLEPELQATKEDLKKYLIASAYELENEKSDEEIYSKHTYIKQETTKRMFIDCEKPLENKTIMLEDKSKIQLDEKSMLKSLKLKFGYDKTII